MKVGDLIDLLYTYDNNDEIEIEVYETSSGHYIDTTAAITISEDMIYVPTLRIDIDEYYGAAEPPVRCKQSHRSGYSEPAALCRKRLFT